MTLVFDSSALIAYLHNEPGADLVDSLLLDVDNACFAHAVNLCEVFYDARRYAGEENAHAAMIVLRKAGVIFREDMDADLWQGAARIKADLRRVSLADCFCTALAQRIDAEIITADHEFDPVAEKQLCKVRFIR